MVILYSVHYLVHYTLTLHYDVPIYLPRVIVFFEMTQEFTIPWKAGKPSLYEVSIVTSCSCTCNITHNVWVSAYPCKTVFDSFDLRPRITEFHLFTETIVTHRLKVTIFFVGRSGLGTGVKNVDFDASTKGTFAQQPPKIFKKSIMLTF